MHRDCNVRIGLRRGQSKRFVTKKSRKADQILGETRARTGQQRSTRPVAGLQGLFSVFAVRNLVTELSLTLEQVRAPRA